MEDVSAQLKHLQAERMRLEKQARSKEKTGQLWRERAWCVVTIAFCRVPTAGEEISKAVLRKYGDCIDMDVAQCTSEMEKRFLETPVDKLAQWLDWEADIPEAELLEPSVSWKKLACSHGYAPRTAYREYRHRPSSSGRNVALCPSRIAANLTPAHRRTDLPIEVQAQRNGCRDSDSAGAWPWADCQGKNCCRLRFLCRTLK